MNRAIACTLMFAGCVSVRNPAVYENEVSFFLELAQQQTEELEVFIKSECCTNGELSQESSCKKAAELVVVSNARASWHAEMMLFLGGVIKDRPSNVAPSIPSASAACAGD